MAFNYSPKIVTDGLVLCLDAGNPRSYPGSGNTWTDLSRGRNNGTLVNGPTFNGDNQGSIVFDGGNDRVNIELSTPLKISNSTLDTTQDFKWTIQFWFKTDAIYNGDSVPRHTFFSFLGNNFTGDGYRYWSFEIWGNNYYRTFNGNGANFTQGSVSATSNNAYEIIYSDKPRFITATINTKQIEIYQNNNIKIFDRTSIYAMESRFLSLGTRNSNLLDGRMYSFSLYNKVLPPSEILQNYNATKGRFGL